MNDGINDEKYERIKKYIDRYSYVDLVIWRNELISSGKINNRLYALIDKEINTRRFANQEKNKKGMKR